MTKAKKRYSSTRAAKLRTPLKTSAPAQLASPVPGVGLRDLMQIVDESVKRTAHDVVRTVLINDVTMSSIIEHQVEMLAERHIEKVINELQPPLSQVAREKLESLNREVLADVAAGQVEQGLGNALTDLRFVDDAAERPIGTIAIPPAFNCTTADHIVSAVHCDSCSAVHDLDATSYVTYHGRITIGESREVSARPLRLCINRGCWEAIAKETQSAFSDAMNSEQVAPNRNPFPPRGGKISTAAAETAYRGYGAQQAVGRG